MVRDLLILVGTAALECPQSAGRLSTKRKKASERETGAVE
jgi:hypothetical protein